MAAHSKKSDKEVSWKRELPAIDTKKETKNSGSAEMQITGMAVEGLKGG